MYEDLRKYFVEELAREPEERQDSTNRMIKSLEGLAKYQPAFENGVKALEKGFERLWAQAEPGLNDVADMALALMKAAKAAEDSGALAPLDGLIRKAHEGFTRPQDAFGGLSLCEVLSAFQKRAESELEKIITMLNAYYYQPLVSTSRNTQTAVVVSPAESAGQKLLHSPSEKYACPHASQGFFPPHCDDQGRCRLDFPLEYRHSDIHLEGDPAMKNSLPALCLSCLLLALPACQYNDEPKEYYDLVDAYLAFYHDEISAEELLKLCDRALEKDAVGRPKFLEMVYSARNLVFLKAGDCGKAEEEARKAIAAGPGDNNKGWLTMSDTLAACGKLNDAADALEQMLDNPNLLPGEADKYRELAAYYREAAKIRTPEELDAKFAVDEQDADKKLRGVSFTLRGEIKSLDFETWSEPIIVFEGSTPERKVSCYFYPDTQDKYSHLKPGQTVTISGIYNGISQGELIVGFCELISVETQPQP